MPDNEYWLSSLAGEDLQGIWLYTYDTWSIEQADRYYQQIVGAFAFLADNPREGKNIDHIRKGYLRYAVGKHFIFYKEIPEGIRIIRILGQVMDIPRHL